MSHDVAAPLREHGPFRAFAGRPWPRGKLPADGSRGAAAVSADGSGARGRDPRRTRVYDDADGLLHHVGFAASFAGIERRALAAIVEPLIEPPGFTGTAPGGPSRWSPERSGEWQPVRPALVCEVRYDHFAGGRFRHGTKFLRWRPDKAPRQCTLAQVQARAA